jgi:DNA polymerase-3 subunit gamma/tau
MTAQGESTQHTALYRKYRPRSLDDFVGQSHVVEILRRSLKQGKVAHAYLLTGPKGTGKTTIARILAHDINQLPYDEDKTHLDIIEIDAASNNGVDDVRELRDKVTLAPIAASKKIYIIDEVHMLSKPAFNALLKTLEEPPAHVVFILATTDLHKVPATIISRTQHFTIHTYSATEIITQLKKIAAAEKITITDDALAAIAARGEGSFRNSISLLDQLSSFADSDEGVTVQLVESTLGLAPSDAVATLLAAVADRDVAAVITQLDQLETDGIQPTVLADQLISAIRAQLAEQPQAVTLLDDLLSVAGSSQPQLKLLTVLVGAIKPKTAPAAVTRAARPAPQVVEAPVAIVAAPVPVTTPAPQVPATATPEAEAPAEPAKKTAKKRPTGTPVELDWNQLLDYVKKNLVALHSVLSKCTHSLEGDTLTLYTGLKFNKTKLDQAKYLTQLQEALATLGADGLEIVTIATAKPPEDEQLASIAAMMGGGQEVALEESAGEAA